MSARDRLKFPSLPTLADLDRLGPRQAGLFIDGCAAVRQEAMYTGGGVFDPKSGAMDAFIAKAIADELHALDQLRFKYYATQPEEEREREAARQLVAAQRAILWARIQDREIAAQLSAGRLDLEVPK